MTDILVPVVDSTGAVTQAHEAIVTVGSGSGTVQSVTDDGVGVVAVDNTDPDNPIIDSPAFGSSAGTITQGNDARLSDSRPPNGSVGGDLTGTYPSPTIGANKVTNSQLAQMANKTFKGRHTAGTGDPEDVSAANLKADLAIANTDVSGLGTMSTQNANAVSISGGSITGITDLAIADGGTGQSTASAAFDALSPLTTQGDILFRNATTNTRLGPATSGQALISGGAAANPAWGTVVDVQVISATGANTWTKPANAEVVDVLLIGAGGGGASGRRGATSTNRNGGGGGGGGAARIAHFNASELGATETVTIGAGGTAGAAVGSDSTDGNNGGTGGTTSFGSWMSLLGGGGGVGGTATNDGTNGGLTSSSNSGAHGLWGVSGTQTGGAGSYTATAGAGGDAPAANFGGSGGGGGGGIDSANTQRNGGAGGNGYSGGGEQVVGSAGGAGSAVVAGTRPTLWGAGTGGGGGRAANLQRTGAAGAIGGGGGGGGATLNGTNSGAGGVGGNGYAIVVSYR